MIVWGEDEPLPGPGDAEKLQRAGREYFRALLRSCETQTPLPLLSAAFRWAAVEHDCLHCGDGWLEGGHWFACYWTNNFQISAALALGQDEAARRARAFWRGIRKRGSP